MKILIVEDSEHLNTYLKKALVRAGYDVESSLDGAEGLWMAESNAYDLILLDVMLPNVDGFTILERLRQQEVSCHILMLTAKDQLEDKIYGLDSGADDYLVKPFEMAELMARVTAIMRRAVPQKKGCSLKVGPVSLDLELRQATAAGKLLDLTRREFALLECFMKSQGKVLTRTQIEQAIYDSNAELMSNAVNSAVSVIRKKLASAGCENFIQTKRGHGYLCHAHP